MKKITIVDYGSGNVLSAQKSFVKIAKDNNIEVDVLISKKLNDVKNLNPYCIAWPRSLFYMHEWFKKN